MSLYFCVGQVHSVLICFNVKCQLCFWERSGMSSSAKRGCDSETPQGKVHSSLLPQTGLQVILTCLASVPITCTQQNYAQFAPTVRSLRGQLTAEHFSLTKDQLMNLFSCALSFMCWCLHAECEAENFALPLCPFLALSLIWKSKWKGIWRSDTSVLFFPVFCMHCYQVCLDRNWRLM